MLNFDEARFVGIQTGAVQAGMALRATIGELLDRGAQNLFFLGAGGAGVLMQPAALLLDRCSTFPVRVVHAAEIVVMPWHSLGPTSIVVVPSLSGTTSEAITVLEHARAAGATTITLTGYAESPVAQLADHNVTNLAADDTSSESFYLQSLLLVLAILEHRGEFPDYDRVVTELATLPTSLLEVKRAFEDTRRHPRQRHQGHRLPRHHRRRRLLDPEPGTTAPASSKKCSGSRHGPSTPPTSSTAPWNCSKKTPACWYSRAKTNHGRSSTASKPGHPRCPNESPC